MSQKPRRPRPETKWLTRDPANAIALRPAFLPYSFANLIWRLAPHCGGEAFLFALPNPA